MKRKKWNEKQFITMSVLFEKYDKFDVVCSDNIDNAISKLFNIDTRHLTDAGIKEVLTSLPFLHNVCNAHKEPFYVDFRKGDGETVTITFNLPKKERIEQLKLKECKCKENLITNSKPLELERIRKEIKTLIRLGANFAEIALEKHLSSIAIQPAYAIKGIEPTITIYNVMEIITDFTEKFDEVGKNEYFITVAKATLKDSWNHKFTLKYNLKEDDQEAKYSGSYKEQINTASKQREIKERRIIAIDSFLNEINFKSNDVSSISIKKRAGSEVFKIILPQTKEYVKKWLINVIKQTKDVNKHNSYELSMIDNDGHYSSMYINDYMHDEELDKTTHKTPHMKYADFKELLLTFTDLGHKKCDEFAHLLSFYYTSYPKATIREIVKMTLSDEKNTSSKAINRIIFELESLDALKFFDSLYAFQKNCRNI